MKNEVALAVDPWKLETLVLEKKMASKKSDFLRFWLYPLTPSKMVGGVVSECQESIGLSGYLMKKNKQNELTVMEASQILGVGPRSVLNYIRSKEVSATKIGKNWRIRWSPHEFLKLGAIQA